MAHQVGCATESFLWRIKWGCATKICVFLWRTLGVRHRKNLVARILWRTQQFGGCATELQFGAPLIALSVVVFYQMHTVSPSYSPTVAHECPHIKCTVGRMQGIRMICIRSNDYSMNPLSAVAVLLFFISSSWWVFIAKRSRFQLPTGTKGALICVPYLLLEIQRLTSARKKHTADPTAHKHSK